MNIYKTSCIAAAAVICTVAAFSCVKNAEVETNSAEKLYFESWMHVNYPDVQPSGNGIYIIEDIPGDGEKWAKRDSITYAFVTYTMTGLDGTINSTNDEEVARQLGTYSKANFYGSAPWSISDDTCYEGVQEIIEGMRIGGKRKVIVPSWLMTYSRYATAEDYLKHGSDVNSTIYTISLNDRVEDIIKWQIDSIERYNARHLEGVDSTYYGNDTTGLKYGFYYLVREAYDGEDKDEFTMPNDTIVYINYTGRLLNGQVFDTTIKDTAKVHNIYDPSRTYAPVSITLAENYSDISMGSSASGLITGFQAALSMMKPMEKISTVFYSSLGYGSGGSGNKIPGYSPLRFDIELTEQP